LLSYFKEQLQLAFLLGWAASILKELKEFIHMWHRSNDSWMLFLPAPMTFTGV